MLLQIRGADLVTPAEVVERGQIAVSDGRIQALGRLEAAGRADAEIAAEGLTAFPGLINAHEHLFGTWSPRSGNGPYPNVYLWLADYFDNPVRRERMSVPDELVAGLGGYRNLISGVTTAVDHDRRRDPGLFRRVPIRAFHDFGREWVLRSESHPSRFPPWGRGIAIEAAEGGGARPFIIHAAEGVDDEAFGEIDRLAELGGLRDNTVLVHAIALTDPQVLLIAARGASVAWCPASNLFLYGVTADVKKLAAAGIRVCLGTDSTSTGSPNLLDELRAARDAWAARYGAPPEPWALVDMVTTAAAGAIRMEGRLGELRPGAHADVLLVDTQGADPHCRLVDSRPVNVDLLLMEGKPLFGAARHEALFRACGVPFSRMAFQGSEKLAAGDFPGLLREVRAVLGREKSFHFLPLGV